MNILGSNQHVFSVKKDGDSLIISDENTGEKHVLVRFYDKRYKKWGWIRENWVKKHA